MISCLKLVRLMEELCPEIDVQVGRRDRCTGGMDQRGWYKGWQQWLKAAFVCMISFFGTAFYHYGIS